MRLPVNVQHWEHISFLHWPYPAVDVAGVLDGDGEVLTFGGVAWVGVTPFFIRVRPGPLPVTPPGCAFPETNVRTYVSGPDGLPAIRFLRMEVPARWFVLVMRQLGLPYVRQAAMSVTEEGDGIAYRSSPAPGGDGGHHVVVRPGDIVEPPHGDAFERFLTARWAALHRRGPLTLSTPVSHRAWPLRRAAVERCEVDDLLAAAGLDPPRGRPLAHYSTGVATRVGLPRLVRTGRG